MNLLEKSTSFFKLVFQWEYFQFPQMGEIFGKLLKFSIITIVQWLRIILSIHPFVAVNSWGVVKCLSTRSEGSENVRITDGNTLFKCKFYICHLKKKKFDLFHELAYFPADGRRFSPGCRSCYYIGLYCLIGPDVKAGRLITSHFSNWLKVVYETLFTFVRE